MTTPPATDARRVFRGPIATLLFPLVGAAAGAAVALIAGPPSLYSSSGLIGLPAGPALEEGDTGLRAGASLAVNDRVLEDLIVIAHSPRVHDLALLDPVWKTMGRPPSPAAVGERLKATREAGGFVRITCRDADPVTAAAAATAAVHALGEVMRLRDDFRHRSFYGLLQDRLGQLAAQGEQKTKAIDALRQGAAGDGDPAANLADLRREIARLQAKLHDESIDAPPASPPPPADKSGFVAPAATHRANLESLIKTLQEQARRLNQAVLELQTLQHDRDALDRERAQIQTRLENMKLRQASGTDVINVFTTGEVPAEPTPSRQARLWFAARAAALGAMITLLLLTLVRLAGPRESKVPLAVVAVNESA